MLADATSTARKNIYIVNKTRPLGLGKKRSFSLLGDPMVQSATTGHMRDASQASETTAVVDPEPKTDQNVSVEAVEDEGAGSSYPPPFDSTPASYEALEKAAFNKHFSKGKRDDEDMRIHCQEPGCNGRFNSHGGIKPNAVGVRRLQLRCNNCKASRMFTSLLESRPGEIADATRIMLQNALSSLPPIDKQAQLAEKKKSMLEGWIVTKPMESKKPSARDDINQDDASDDVGRTSKRLRDDCSEADCMELETDMIDPSALAPVSCEAPLAIEPSSTEEVKEVPSQDDTANTTELNDECTYEPVSSQTFEEMNSTKRVPTLTELITYTGEVSKSVLHQKLTEWGYYNDPMNLLKVLYAKIKLNNVYVDLEEEKDCLKGQNEELETELNDLKSHLSDEELRDIKIKKLVSTPLEHTEPSHLAPVPAARAHTRQKPKKTLVPPRNASRPPDAHHVVASKEGRSNAAQPPRETYAQKAARPPSKGNPPKPGNEARHQMRLLVSTPMSKLNQKAKKKILAMGQERPRQSFHRLHIVVSSVPNETVTDARRRMGKFLVVSGLNKYVKAFSNIGKHLLEIYFCDAVKGCVERIIEQHALRMKSINPADFSNGDQDVYVLEKRREQAAKRLGHLLARESNLTAMVECILDGFDEGVRAKAQAYSKEILDNWQRRWATKYRPASARPADIPMGAQSGNTMREQADVSMMDFQDEQSVGGDQ